MSRKELRTADTEWRDDAAKAARARRFADRKSHRRPGSFFARLFGL